MISKRLPITSIIKEKSNKCETERDNVLKTPTRAEFSKLKQNYGKFIDTISQASTSGAVCPFKT